MKTARFMALGLVLLAQMAVANAAGHRGNDVLATCENAGDHSPSFSIIGDKEKFANARLGVVTAEVALKDGANRDAFPGQVTLTKGAPYQFSIYGVAKPKNGGTVTPTLYGWSAGTTLVVQEVRSSQDFTQYICTLHASLLALP